MKFDSQKIVYSAKENWDELVSITFVKDKNYLSFNSLIYEDEIGIELNDQINFISVNKHNFSYELNINSLIIKIINTVIQNNLTEKNFEIYHYLQHNEFNELNEALKALISTSEE